MAPCSYPTQEEKRSGIGGIGTVRLQNRRSLIWVDFLSLEIQDPEVRPWPGTGTFRILLQKHNPVNAPSFDDEIDPETYHRPTTAADTIEQLRTKFPRFAVCAVDIQVLWHLFAIIRVPEYHQRAAAILLAVELDPIDCVVLYVALYPLLDETNGI